MEDEKKAVLDWPDYLILVIILSISAGAGIYFRFTGGRQKTAQEYFAANRTVNVIPLGVALMVSFVSATSVLGISSEVYAHGYIYFVHFIGAAVAMIVVSLFYLPVMFELNVISVYEYLERRFGGAARLTTSIANTIQLTLFTGVVLYAPSLAMEAVTGLSSNTSVVILTVICVFYSSIGGIKAILATDVLQALLMFISLICIMVVAKDEIEGGLDSVWKIAIQNDRFDFSAYQFDPAVRHTWWCLIFGSFVIFTAMYGCNQIEVQRLTAVRSIKSARIALLINYTLTTIFACMTGYCGLIFYAVYKDCDPVASKKIMRADGIMPYFAVTKLSIYPGIMGLFISGIFSASLSTISASFNSLAAVMIEDYIKSIYAKLGRTFPESKSTLFGKVLAIVNGAICLVVAFLAAKSKTLVGLTLSTMGVMCGPVLGIFTLGIFFEGPNEKGAIFGMITAFIICAWACFGGPRPELTSLPTSTDRCNFTVPIINTTLYTPEPPKDPASYFYLYRISYMWYGPMGLIITVVIGYIASFIFKIILNEPYIEKDTQLFTPLVARIIKRRRAKDLRATSNQIFTLAESVTNNKRVMKNFG